MDEERLLELVCRLDLRLRRFPAGACCSSCGGRNPLAFVTGRKTLLCRECALLRRGLAPVEVHHLGGRPSTHVVPVPANLHALLGFLQELWRGQFAPGSPEAYLLDLLLLRVLGPSFGMEAP